MNRRIEKEEGIAYLVEDYKEKNSVIEDLDKSLRVAIIAKDEDVLSFYGALLERYGQFNLYPVDDFEDVDEEYLDNVTTEDRTKEEVITYVGRPLSEMINECIDSLKLEPNQKRMMSLAKELLKGQKDVRADATMSRLTEKLRKEQAEKNNALAELDMLRTQNENLSKSTEFVRTTVDLNGVTSNTSILYVREFNNLPYFNTFLLSYVNYLEIKKGKRAKIVIFDDRMFDYLYKDELKVDSAEAYTSNRGMYLKPGVLVCYQVFPAVILDLYKSSFDQLIFIDRILNRQEMIRGKNVHKLATLSNKAMIDYVIRSNLFNDYMFAVKEIIPDISNQQLCISKINKPLPDLNTALYWYSKLPNIGEDNRLLFEVLDDYCINVTGKSRR